jgi:hypothetical protein
MGKRLQPVGDLRDLLCAVVTAIDRAVDQLQVVDNDQADSGLAALAACLRSDLRHRQATRLVDVERQILEPLPHFEEPAHCRVSIAQPSPL